MTNPGIVRSGFFITAVKGKEMAAFEEFNAFMRQTQEDNWQVEDLMVAIRQKDAIETGEITYTPIKPQEIYSKNIESDKPSGSIENGSVKVLRLLEMFTSCFITSLIIPIKNEIDFSEWTFKYINNIVYLEEIYKVGQEDFISLLKQYMERKLSLYSPNSYRINYRCRCCTVDKLVIFQIIIDLCKGSKVNLQEPEYEIVFQGLKGFGGVSVVKYKKRNNLNKKFNK